MTAEDDTTALTPVAALEQHREHIDRIDKTIVALLAQRIRFGLAAGTLKRALNRPTRSDVREAEVLDRVRHTAARPLSAESAERIFRAIIEETRAAEERAGE